MSRNRVSNLALAPLIRPNKTILNLKNKKKMVWNVLEYTYTPFGFILSKVYVYTVVH